MGLQMMRDALVYCGVREITCELRGQGGHVERPARPARAFLAAQMENQCGQKREPRAPNQHSGALRPKLAMQQVDAPADQKAETDEQRHEAEGQQEQHRDEEQLRWHGRAGAELELEPRQDPEAEAEKNRRDRVERARRAREHGERDRRREKGTARQ